MIANMSWSFCCGAILHSISCIRGIVAEKQCFTVSTQCQNVPTEYRILRKHFLAWRYCSMILYVYFSWFSLTVSSDMSPTTSTTTMKANFDASITLEPWYFNEGPSDCKNMFVVTGFRYIEVLFRLEPKGFPIFYSVLLQRRRKHVQHPTNPGVRVKDYTISWKSA